MAESGGVGCRAAQERLGRERFIWMFRAAASAFAVTQTAIEPGDDATVSWVSLAIFLVAVVLGGLALRRTPADRTVRRIGAFTMAVDAAYVSVILANNLTDPAEPVYLIGLLVMLEATIRWRRIGGIVAAVVAGAAAGAWTVVASTRVLGEPNADYASMRAGVIIALGVFLGWLVRRLTEQHDQLQGVLDTTRDLIVSVNLDGRIVRVLGDSVGVLGYRPEELEGRAYRELIHPDDVTRPGRPPLLPTDGAVLLERRVLCRDGQYRWLELNLSAGPKGDVLHVSARDVTERRETDRRIQESEQRFRSLFEHNTDAVYAFDLEGRFTMANPAAEAITGFTVEELTGSSFAELMEPASLDATQEHFRRATQGESRSYETAILDRNGRRIDLDVINSPIVVDGEIVGVFGVAKDVTERRRLARELGHQATHDALTGLPNRAHLEAVLGACTADGERRTLLFIDLDRFKLVNDSLGHRCGDEVLVAAVERLGRHLRGNDLLARWAGDEFCVLLSRDTDDEVALVVADRLRAVLAEPFAVGDRQVRLSASIGLASAASEDLERLVQIADHAMYEAKRAGRDRVVVYTGSGEPAITQLDLETDLADALDAGAIGTYYQPIVDAHSGEIRAVEALVRWPRADGTLWLPAAFVPVAEECGLIRPLTRAVLADACAQLARWDDLEVPDQLQAWVNVSVADLESRSFGDDVTTVLASTGVDPKRLVLEVTETMLMRDAAQVTCTIEELRRAGVSFAIDDFGTGYSSLSQLQRLRVAACKIDREFVSQAPEQVSDAGVLKALVDVGLAFGLPVVAEGIERPEELAAAVAAGCQLAQGYLLAAPAAAGALDDLLRRGRVELPASRARLGSVRSAG